ncbi:MAG TPA: hypothetical protein VL501_05345, partial [Pyrinomonadaceae bacterium]|nr:hypothetical protein [Pyrinomonadaceae bacterium]
MTRHTDNKLGRRDFLRILGSSGIGVIASLAARSLPRLFAAGGESYRLLVVGDSLIWGQGLKESEKIYSLVAEWLGSEVLRGDRRVELLVKAHSGSTLKFHPEDAEKYKRIGRDETYPYHPEINVAMPSIWKQIEVAAEEYKLAGSRGADLIIMSGGLPDLSVERILDPKGKDAKLRADIQRYCHDDMLDGLRLAAERHPDATIAVIGYFTMVSPMTSSSKLLNGWLESMSFPRFLKPFLNNPVVRAVYFKGISRKVQSRSKIWFEESSRALSQAVDDLNRERDTMRAVFVPSPIT